MEKVELFLKAMSALKTRVHFSCDIYYDDLRNEFVVKLSNFGDNFTDKHFRNYDLSNACNDAYQFVQKNT